MDENAQSLMMKTGKAKMPGVYVDTLQVRAGGCRNTRQRRQAVGVGEAEVAECVGTRAIT